MSCSSCQQAARFVEYRSNTVTSLLGDIRVERPYYHCKHCGAGCHPFDATLRLAPQRPDAGRAGSNRPGGHPGELWQGCPPDPAQAGGVAPERVHRATHQRNRRRPAGPPSGARRALRRCRRVAVAPGCRRCPP
jgi:hypothetical protein